MELFPLIQQKYSSVFPPTERAKKANQRTRRLVATAGAIPLLFAGIFAGRSWQEGPPLVEERWFHATAAASNGEIFVLGGWITEGPTRRRVPPFGHAFEVFDPNEQKWQQGPEPPAYHYHWVVHYYRTVLAPGLRSADAEQVPAQEEQVQEDKPEYEAPFAAIDVQDRLHWFAAIGPIYFDATSGKWGQPPGPTLHQPAKFWTKRVDREDSVPTLRRAGGSTAAGPDGRLYLTGGTGRGLDDQKTPKTVLAALEIYDPATDSWAVGAPMLHKRQVHASTFGPDGKLYVFGGCACFGGGIQISSKDEKANARAVLELLEESRSVRFTEVYDPATNHWEERAPMPTPRQQLSASLGKDGLIYVIGGAPSYGAIGLDTVEVYDPATDRWATGPSLRRPRESHSSAVTPDGRIWVTGGTSPSPGLFSPIRLLRGDYGGAQRSVEVLDTAPRQ